MRIYKKCSIEGCPRDVQAYGLCKKHDRAHKLYGDPLAVKQVQFHHLSLHDRLYARVTKHYAGCWEWTGGKDKYGYGRMNIYDQPILVHRISWALEHDEIPPPANKDVLHHCDNPSCIRPSHLFLGDAQANMADKMQKGRHRYGVNKGEAHGMAKLTEEGVRDILTSTESLGVLAARYGVSKTNVADVRKRRIWRHVSLPTT